MYKTVCIVLKDKDAELKKYCDIQCHNAKLLKNSVIFRLRQLYFAWQNDYICLSEHEKEVLDEFYTTYDKYTPIGKKHMFPTYNQFDRMFRNTQNVDYFNGLPMQCSQAIIKEGLQDFRGYFNALKKYRKDPSKFIGKPQFPKYARSESISFDITNQDAVIYGNELKLPKIKTKLKLGSLEYLDNLDGSKSSAKLKEVTIKPYYDTYKICITFEVADEVESFKTPDKARVLGIDLGVNNIITTSNNCGILPFVIKGNEIKSLNQWYNKKLAEYTSKLRTSTKDKPKYSSKKIQQLNKYRKNYVTDKYNKIASYVMKYCVLHDIGTIVIGKNDQWKFEVKMQKKDKQNFTHISHTELINKIKMVATNFGINVIETEESFTSVADFLSMDFLPTYGESYDDPDVYIFSGKRFCRGLYRSAENIIMNADVNGASNIIRKALGNEAFKDINDFSYLYETVNVVRI